MRQADFPALLLVDKPEGPTSHDVVQMARRALGVKRVGHTGTLDPFATGLLLLCVGRATRLVEYFHLLSKVYSATAVLGVETDTEDRTGTVVGRSEAWRAVTRQDIDREVEGLRGEQAQIPPAFSAKKVAGRRAYEAARAGEAMDLAVQSVSVHSLEVVDLRPPEVEFIVDVSTGTYVRSLARDLGRRLGCGAHLGALRRLSIGPFTVANAVSLTDLKGGSLPGSASFTAARAVSWLPVRNLSESEVAGVEHGRPIPHFDSARDSHLPVAMMYGERLVAVGRRESELLRPEKVFHDA